MRIEIKGTIVGDGNSWIYDWLEIPYTSPSKVNKALADAKGEEIEVIINSGGGSVYAGSEIYTSLKEYKGHSVGKIVGIAASAASVIAMGVDQLMMSPTGQMMIHNASIYFGGGNKQDFTKTAGILDNIDKSIANAYKLKTGLSQEELLDLMNKETWMTTQEAKEKRFIDGIMFDDGISFENSISNGFVIPQKIINKLKNEKLNIMNTSKNKLKTINNLEKQKLKLQLELI